MGTQKLIFIQKFNFCIKIAFWLQNCIMGLKSTFEQKFHFLGSVRAKSPKWVRVCEFVRVPKRTFCSKTRCSSNFSFLLQNHILHSKSDFWLKKWFLGQKSDFCDFDQNWLHLAFVFTLFGAKCRNNHFYDEIYKNVWFYFEMSIFSFHFHKLLNLS